MGRANIKQVRQMKEVPERLEAMSVRTPGAVKVGGTTSYYLYVDKDEVRLKSNGVGMIMNKDITVVQPGACLSFQVPYQKVDFNKMYFHPAADIPSTAVFPHPTFTPCWNDPSIKLVNGTYSSLKGITALGV